MCGGERDDIRPRDPLRILPDEPGGQVLVLTAYVGSFDSPALDTTPRDPSGSAGRELFLARPGPEELGAGQLVRGHLPDIVRAMSTSLIASANRSTPHPDYVVFGAREPIKAVWAIRVVRYGV